LQERESLAQLQRKDKNNRLMIAERIQNTSLLDKNTCLILLLKNHQYIYIYIYIYIYTYSKRYI